MNRKAYILAFGLTMMLILLMGIALADGGSFVIPKNTVTIAEDAFYGNTSMNRVIVQEGVVSIGERAFANSGLAEIDLPRSLESLASTAFDGCGKLVVNAPQTSAAAQQVQAMIDSGKTNLTLELMIPTLQEGNNTVYAAEGAYTVTAFTADKAGIYTFYSTGSVDTSGHLYNETGTIDITDDDSGSDYNFLISQALTAGEAVCLGVKYDQASASGSMTVVIEFTEEPATVYRALLIGQKNFSPVCYRNEADVTLMKKTLASVNGGEYQISTKIDRTKAQVRSDIQAAFGEATENDVSLFFYASHGVTGSNNYGALCTYKGEYIQTSEIASWLAEVPGKVIVVIQTCGSGAVIEANANGTTFDSEALDAAIIEAFAEADTLEADPKANRGEMRSNKFYVMTASLGGELSWGWEGYKPNNFFTVWFTDGVGTSGQMTADTDKNGSLTLSELYDYVKATAASTPISYGGTNYYQHPQVYPEGSSYVLFTR